MGQSVTRINDRSAVPGTGGIYDRPMIGVGREGGSEQAPSPETAGVPNPNPIRRKQTLGDQQHPASIPKPNETPAKNASDEQKGFRGRLRRGWLTTIGVFQRKHDAPGTAGGKKDNDDTIATVAPKSAPASPTATGSVGSSPTTPIGTPVRARTHSSPAMTGHHVHTPPVTATGTTIVPPTSGGAAATPPTSTRGVISPRAIRPRSDSVPAQVPSLLNDDNDSITNEKPVTSYGLPSQSDIITSPRGGIHQRGAAGMGGVGSGMDTGGSGSGASHMQLWWRQHHGALEHMMPPRYAAGNSQSDELHRESRDPTYQPSNPSYEQHEPNSPSISKGGMVGSFDEAIPPTTMKPHRNIGQSGVNMSSKKRSASPNRSGGSGDGGGGTRSIDNQQQHVAEHGNLNDRRAKGMKHNNNDNTNVAGLPPMLSPWNTQPDELHREPPIGYGGWRGTGTGQGYNTNMNKNNTNDGQGGKGASQQQQQQHVHHYWPPGQQSLHNNDAHTQPGGWPMNP